MPESFLIYKGFYPPIKSLTDVQLGKLFRCIFLYQIEGVEKPDDDIRMAFDFFLNQFRVDEIKYNKTCDKNKENALKRWNKDNATACDGINGIPKMPTDAKHAYNDTDTYKEKEPETVTDIVTDNEIDKIIISLEKAIPDVFKDKTTDKRIMGFIIHTRDKMAGKTLQEIKTQFAMLYQLELQDDLSVKKIEAVKQTVPQYSALRDGR